MLALYLYLAVAAAFYLSSWGELGRSRAGLREDAADHLILHLVAVLGALLWAAALPALARSLVRRVRPRQSLHRLRAWIVARLPRRAHAAG